MQKPEFKAKKRGQYPKYEREGLIYMASDKYDEIMNLPHHVSDVRPQMTMIERAAQFAPFAALTGYDDVIKEAGRVTDGKVEMDESALDFLGIKMRLLSERLGEEPQVTFTCFKPDARKSGGAYLTVSGVVKKIDEYERVVVMSDGTRISMDDILGIESLAIGS